MSDIHSNNIPLAEKMRPKTIEGFAGQEKLVGKNRLLSKTLADPDAKLPSLLLWGPPGTGKTTLARIIAASRPKAELFEISAVTSGLPELRKLFAMAESRFRLNEESILFVDEIHRFSKTQQDALLPYVEKGIVTLIGATTENPSFEVIKALLSRSTVLILEPLAKDALMALIQSATKQHLKPNTITKKNAELLAELSAGDARTALNALQTAATISEGKAIGEAQIMEALQDGSRPRHDKNGEDHYNLISALIKSMRASHPGPAQYYLHRLLEGGEPPEFIARRLIIFAAEDIGMASPHALTLAVSTFDGVHKVGMPESNYILSQAVLALSKAPKSREATNEMYVAKELVAKHPHAQVPLHIRNAPTALMKDLGYAQWDKETKKTETDFWPKEMRKS